MGSAWLIPDSYPSTGNQNVWSGLVPPPHPPRQTRLLHRCHGDGKQWRVLLTLGEWGWAGGLGVGRQNVCVGRRVPRAVGEPASPLASQPLPYACPGLRSPFPSRYRAVLPCFVLAKPRASTTPRNSTSHLPA